MKIAIVIKILAGFVVLVVVEAAVVRYNTPGTEWYAAMARENKALENLESAERALDEAKGEGE